MPDSPITIFISYAHADSSFVDRLEADLRQRGFNTWMDRRGLAGGQKWRRELQEAIDRSQILLVVLSPNAVESQYIQAEYGYAIDEGKVVIPLYYRPCKVPMELRGIQWIDFQHVYEQGLESLLQALAARGGTSSPPASEVSHLSQEESLPAPLDSQPQLTLPSGTVTFLVADIEGSTTRWEEYPEAMRTMVARYDALLRSVISARGGFVFKMVGDAVYAAFATPGEAVAAAAATQQAIAAEQWGERGPLRVRMALHTGVAQSHDADYFGPTLNRVARLLSAASGGQVLLSAVTQELIRDSLPEGVKLKDLGEHALKDLLRPEHVYQLVLPGLISEFPPLKSLSRRAQNLPMQPTSFVGREQEVNTVCELLHRPEVRLLTLTGPGGIGKTRLALHVAAELAEQFSDGVFLVSLAAISDSEQVAAAIMQTLGISDNSGQAPLNLLKRTLKDKQMLLLLDNFEQVVDAAVIVADLLAVSPGLKVLVTSRSVLHVRSEYEFVVLPLSMPDPRHLPADLITLSQYEAVALFIQRAQAVKPDFALTATNAPAVAAICARLDGLPLAIELAAARSKFFAPQVLLSRLEQGLAVLSGGARDLPSRQQTLRNTIQWSYDLLSREEQRLFRWLSVFVGGCTLEAADAVYQPDTDSTIDVLEEVMSLQDKSLLQQTEQESEEPRLLMLETIREYGLERLRANGELEAAQQGHARYYLALAEQATPYLTRTSGIRRRPRNRRNLPEETEPYLGDAEQRAWLERLEREYENLRAALQWAAVHGDDEMKLTLRLSSGLLAFRIWAKETE